MYSSKMRYLMEIYISNSSGVPIYAQITDQIRNKILRILNPYGKPDHPRRHACLCMLLIRHLPVGMAGRMKDAGTGVRHMSDNSRQLQAVHKAHRFLPSAF